MKKTLAILLSLCFVTMLLPIVAFAEGATSGILTETINWSYENGTLTITGTGDMPDYSNTAGDANHVSTAPWFEYSEQITSLVIGEGITKIGIYTFGGSEVYQNLESVSLPEGLVEIARHSFYICPSLTTFNLPNSLEKIGRNVFYSSKIEEFNIGPKLTILGIEEGMNPFDNQTTFTYAIGARTFNVHPDNTAFTVVDGVLYTKDLKALIAYPLGDTSKTTLEIPYGCEILARFSIFGTPSLKTVYLPSTVAKIGMCAFNSAKVLEKLYFYGDAPILGPSVFYVSTSFFDIYYIEGTTGWDTAVWDPYITNAGLALNTFEDDGRYPVIPTVIVGDANGDGEVGLTDALVILRSLAGWTVTLDEEAADVNGDGSIGQIDAMLILRHMAGWTVEQLA